MRHSRHTAYWSRSSIHISSASTMSALPLGLRTRRSALTVRICRDSGGDGSARSAPPSYSSDVTTIRLSMEVSLLCSSPTVLVFDGPAFRIDFGCISTLRASGR